jgi:GTP cyclohydrolase I
VESDKNRQLIRDFITAIGDDPEREGVLETPDRVVRSWKELYGGYQMDPAKILSKTFDPEGCDQMVVCKGIEFYSTCEHHLLPIIGTAHVGYLPKDRVVGLSKMARLVDCFARRLQIQERLTSQVAHALYHQLDALGVGVVVEAKHFCMCARGVNKQGSLMTTSAMLGVFRDNAPARSEFMRLIK